MRIKPLISILVPVYNMEKYLRRFLDSAIQQTYENIEIICIDNLSEDSSYDILMEYQQSFPEKLFVYQAEEHYDYVGRGRNLAFSHSHGEYLFFCDADDIMQYRCIEKLYETAFTYDSDLVCGYAIAVLEKAGHIEKYNLGLKQNLRASNDAAIVSGIELWMRLIKRSLFEKAGLFPEDVTFDDVAHLTVIQSYAENIRFVQYPVYYYFRRENSTVGTPSLEVTLNSIKAEKYALSNSNPNCKNAVLKFVAGRIRGNLTERWQYTDYLIDWLKELMPAFKEDPLITSDKSLYPTLKFLAELKDVKIPERVYLCGFGGKEISTQRIDDISAKAFADGCCEVVVLDESNCNLDENPYIRTAYNNGLIDLVEGYFALKNIYEKGGIYLHDSVNIENCFNFCRYLFGFFGFVDEYTYTDKVFGASEGNEAIKSILNTFSDAWDKKGGFPSLAERIGIILTVKYSIPLDGRDHIYKKPISVLAPNMLVTNVSCVNKSLHSICTVTETEPSDDVITIRKSTMQYFLRIAGTSQPAAPVGKTPRERKLERELYDIRMSNTWKLVQKLRKLGDGPFGPFLKKIFHGLLNIRAKLKGNHA